MEVPERLLAVVHRADVTEEDLRRFAEALARLGERAQLSESRDVRGLASALGRQAVSRGGGSS